MLGKELAFGVCMPLFAIGVEKVLLKVLQVRRMVRWDWNSPLDNHLNVGDIPMEIFSQAWRGRRVGYIVHVVMRSRKVGHIVHVAVEG